MPQSNHRGQYDRERVVTADLAVILIEWRDNWIKERPSQGEANAAARGKQGWSNQERGPKTGHMGAMAAMVQETGIPPRRLYGIMICETKTTSFWLADRILTGLNKSLTLLIRTGQIRELPEEVDGYKVRGMHFKSNEEWFAYLDSIGCGK